jgi:hypothetical protein
MGALASLGLLAFALLAQQKAPEVAVSVQGPEPAVVRLGDTTYAAVVVEGTTRDATIGEVKAPPELDVERLPPSRMTQSYIDGRTMRASSSIAWKLRIRPTKEGVFEIPPIAVKIGADTYNTKPIKVECVRDITGSNYAFLETRFSKAKYFAQEPVRATIRFGIDKAILGSMLPLFNRRLDVEVQIDAPWLGEFPGGVAIDPQPGMRPGDRKVNFAVNQTLADALSLGEKDRGGRPFLVFEFERTWLPGRLGTIELAAPLLRFRYATKFTNDFFGERVPADRQDAFVYGTATTLEILPIPEDGRPASYAGAVGQFTVSAEAIPREVKVGEIVKFKLRIEGSGNLEFLEPPKLDTLEGFHVFGRLDDKGRAARTIAYELAPLSTSVREIPSIPFTFFDTEAGGAFKTVATQAISLIVRPLPAGETLAPLPEDAGKRVTVGVDDIHDIETLASAEDPSTRPTSGMLVFALGAPWIAAAAGFVALRRREIERANPARVRARGAASKYRSAVAGGADAAAAFTTYLADRLGCAEAAIVSDDLAAKLGSAGVPAAAARAAAAQLFERLSARYSPGAAGAEAGRAAAFAERIEELERAFASPGRNR